MRGIIIGLVLLALSGCAAPTTQRPNLDNSLIASEREKQLDLAFEMQMDSARRLYSVAGPILRGAVDMCGEKVRVSNGPGVQMWPDGGRKNIVGSGFIVRLVKEGSEAQKAGFLVGDRLVAMNGVKITFGPQTKEILETVLNDRSHWPTNYTVLRDGKEIDISLMPCSVCNYLPDIIQQDTINAFADGKKIFVTSGMMRFINDDRELALVLSHELAHNIMGHINKKKGNSALGTMVDIWAAVNGVNTGGQFGKVGANAYSQDFEMEADYVGLYIMAKAGYDVSGVANFWRRMAASNPNSIKQQGYFASHPSSPERFVAIEKAAEEIKEKIAAGKSLDPEMKK
ncbi:MAG: M48 family metalloprotease [Deltaproteobacteria bacterium]|nr:M48 family metalloprotease [Deltaproteobacteria bacterium]